MDKLFDYFKRADAVDTDSDLTQFQKDKKLAEIMTEMERVYKIPIFRNLEWEKNNHKVIRTYREISNMRKL